MPYARIFDAHIPMAKTDLVFKCTEYELDLAREKWENDRNRDRSRDIAFKAMAEDGEFDPYRAVVDIESEQRRLMQVWGKKTFERVYTVSQFRRDFLEKTRPANPWAERRERERASADALKQAEAAAATAELVDVALEKRRTEERRRSELAAERQAEEAKRAAHLQQATEQRAKDDAAMARAGVVAPDAEDEDEPDDDTEAVGAGRGRGAKRKA